MRFSPLVLLAAAFLPSSAAVAAPKPGDRTISPDKLLEQLGSGVSDAELERAVQAAAAHPLGSTANPVRVGGPEGEQAYIARLRCADGSTPQVGARGAGGVGAFGTIVDLYPIDCGAAAPGKVALALDMYHEEHREDRPPPGFRIEPR